MILNCLNHICAGPSEAPLENFLPLKKVLDIV